MKEKGRGGRAGIMHTDAVMLVCYKQEDENWELLQVHCSDELNTVVADIPVHKKKLFLKLKLIIKRLSTLTLFNNFTTKKILVWVIKFNNLRLANLVRCPQASA